MNDADQPSVWLGRLICIFVIHIWHKQVFHDAAYLTALSAGTDLSKHVSQNRY